MRRLKTGRRPPIYPKTPGHLPCSSLTHPLPLSSRRPSVSFGGFGLKLTDSPAWVGAVIFSLGLPTLVFTFPAGLAADRWDRRKQLLYCFITFFLASSSFVILTATQSLSPELSLPVAFVFGLGLAFSRPALHALLPVIVPNEHLVNGIALSTMSLNVGRVLAPILAGGLMALSGAAIAMAPLVIISFVAAGTVMAIQVPGNDTGAGERQSGLLVELLSGPKFVLAVGPLFTLLLLMMATSLFIYGPIQTLVPVMIREIFGAGPSALGLTFAIDALGGMFIAMYLLRHRNIQNQGFFYALAMSTLGLSIVGYALLPTFTWSLVLFLLFGVASGLSAATSMAMVLGHTPRELAGRVIALYQIGVWGFIPLGGLLAGFLGELIGVRSTMASSALIAVLLAVTAVSVSKKFRTMS